MPSPMRKGRTSIAKVRAFLAAHDQGKRKSRTRNMSLFKWKLHQLFFPRTARKKAPFDQRKAIPTKRIFPRERQPEWFDRRTLVVVRRFKDKRKLMDELRAIAIIKKVAKKAKFELFTFHPPEIIGIDRKKYRIIERVFKAPNSADLFYTHSWDELAKRNLYGGSFVNRMKEKGVTFETLKEKVKDAYFELKKRLTEEFENYHNWPSSVYADYAENNIIILDYDTKTQKPVISLVDIDFGPGTDTRRKHLFERP